MTQTQHSSAADGESWKGQCGEWADAILWISEDPCQSSSQNGSPVKTGLQILGICYNLVKYDIKKIYKEILKDN